MSVAITEAMTILAEAEQQFNLTRTEDENFVPEWCSDLPALTETEQNPLVEMRRRYIVVLDEA